MYILQLKLLEIAALISSLFLFFFFAAVYFPTDRSKIIFAVFCYFMLIYFNSILKFVYKYCEYRLLNQFPRMLVLRYSMSIWISILNFTEEFYLYYFILKIYYSCIGVVLQGKILIKPFSTLLTQLADLTNVDNMKYHLEDIVPIMSTIIFTSMTS